MSDLLSADNYAFDFVVVTEKWFDSASADLFKLPNYVSFSFPRTTREKSGGICLFIKSIYTTFVFRVQFNLGISTFKWGGVLIKSPTIVCNNKFMLMRIYRPPNRKSRSLPKFINEFNDFNEILANYCHQSRTQLLIAI